ncbi:MAG TPA: phosphotransferase [Acidimicrobiales bacterium]
MERAPGRLIGSGRHADVYELGADRVLRRYRTAQQAGPEAALMEHVRAHGFPAPEVFAADGGDLVMQRVDGPSLLHVMSQAPHRLGRLAALLAELHHRLHEIPAPPGTARPVGSGDAVLHLDLHPANVVVTPDGPVVLDWGWAGAGPADADAAHTWLQMATSEVPGGAFVRAMGAVGRRLLVRQFLSHFDRPRLVAHLDAVAAYRLAVRDLTEGERARIPRFVRS